MALHKDLNGNIHDDMDGTALNLLPAGCVEITNAEADAIRQAAVPPWSREPLLKIARAGREIALNRLAGIGFAAKEAGDSATVTACLDARTALLNITKLPSVQAATDDASLTAAIGAGYAAIVASYPSLVGAFAGIQA